MNRRGHSVTADFTSALTLGLHHPSATLSWTRLSTGTPAALRRSIHADRAAQGFADLVGCQRAVVVSSTLHAFSDLFGASWRPPAPIFHDEAIYPIARWGMERAERRAARVIPFRHLDAQALSDALKKTPPQAPPWLVTDGFCAGCARPAPLAEYVELLRPWGGRLIVDDAQAVGLYGRAPTTFAPYGLGGGGALALTGVAGDPSIVLVASLAKAFGVPLAMVAAARSFIDPFTDDSETLVHCSPPAEPVQAAAVQALATNASWGDALRARLASRVRRLQQAMSARGFITRGGAFPMQRVPMPDRATAQALQAGLSQRGVRAVVRRSRCNDEISLTFIVSARHTGDEIEHAADSLAAAARQRRPQRMANRHIESSANSQSRLRLIPLQPGGLT